MQPAIIFELLPGFAFLLCVSSLSYLWMMRSKQSDVFVAVYSLHSMDLIMSISLFCCAFHGATVLATTDNNTKIRPVRCYLVIHISLWCVLDIASSVILIILCIDQVVSVIWSKSHKTISCIYMQPVFMAAIFLLSFGILKPAWDYAIDNSENCTVKISPFCTMNDVFEKDFYDMEFLMRIVTPPIGFSLLVFAALLLLYYQIGQEWNFKWSDNNKDSVRSFNFVLIRLILNVLALHLPTWLIFKPEFRGPEEVCLRIIYAGVMGVIQPMILLKLFPDYRMEIKKFFCRNLNNNKRTWQSAGDPPVAFNVSSQVDGLDFGSWYSSAGNIVGEFGIPYEINADKQRSVSFYQ